VSARLLVSLDYEIWFTANDDPTAVLLPPTEAILSTCEKHDARATLFVDVLGMIAARRAGLGAFVDAVEDQLRRAVDRGHDAQLHLHPHWQSATFDGTTWRFAPDTYLLAAPGLDAGAITARTEALAQQGIAWLPFPSPSGVFANRSLYCCILAPLVRGKVRMLMTQTLTALDAQRFKERPYSNNVAINLDAVEVNLVLRGQSNLIKTIEGGGWAGARELRAEVMRLLGLDPSRDRINIIYDRDGDNTTAIGGTAFLGNWVKAKDGSWSNGFELNTGSANLIRKLEQTVATNDYPTVVIWLHNETDSKQLSIDPSLWEGAVRWESDYIRAAAGRTADEMPYLFVSAIPHDGYAFSNQRIRVAQEELVSNGFNGWIGARVNDIDKNGDNASVYGGPHISVSDGILIAQRIALSLAEHFASLAKPGSPIALAGGNIADDGPQAIAAARIASDPNSALVRVRHDQAEGLAELDPDAAAGRGWTFASSWSTSTRTNAVAVELIEADLIKVTFADAITSDAQLFYAWGNTRFTSGGSGRNNAIYDTSGLPLWTAAKGLPIGAAGTVSVKADPVQIPEPTPNRPPHLLTLEQAVPLFENAAAGDFVGTIVGHDPDISDSIKLRLIDDSLGRFLLSQSSGALTVAPGAIFDSSSEGNVRVTVEAQDLSGAILTEEFAIAVLEMPNVAADLPSVIVYSDTLGDYRIDRIFKVPTPGEFTGTQIGADSFLPSSAFTLAWNTGSIDLKVTSAWNSLKAVQVEINNNLTKNITITNFVDVNIVGSISESLDVTLVGAKRGVVSTGDGNDSITVNAYSNQPQPWDYFTNRFLIETGSGSDVIEIRSWLNWTNGTVNSGMGDDIINTSAGNDELRGGIGYDIMNGGAGSDKFYFLLGDSVSGDVISDFSIIEGDKLIIPTRSASTLLIQSSADGIILHYSENDFIELRGLNALASNSIVFV
jgi:hypothetical protein